MNKILKHLAAIVLLITLGTTAVLAQDPEQEEDILKQAKQQYTLYRNYFKQKQYAEQCEPHIFLPIKHLPFEE